MFMASGMTRWGSVPAVLLMMQNPAQAAARIVFVETEIDAPVEAVFDAWATAEGMNWFAKAIVEPKVGGTYEVHFLPDAPVGQRGSEGGKILAYEQNRLLTVQWSMPPYMPAIRQHQTMLTLTFERRGDNLTRFTLTHSGFGRGQEWDEGLAYFSKTWPQVVAKMKATVEESERNKR